jgi:hypothetical protein
VIYPVTVSDEELIALHKKINKQRGNVTLADLRAKVSVHLEYYVTHELLLDVEEDYE